MGTADDRNEFVKCESAEDEGTLPAFATDEGTS